MTVVCGVCGVASPLPLVRALRLFVLSSGELAPFDSKRDNDDSDDEERRRDDGVEATHQRIESTSFFVLDD